VDGSSPQPISSIDGATLQNVIATPHITVLH
jgi:hypothetical protein